MIYYQDNVNVVGGVQVTILQPRLLVVVVCHYIKDITD